MFRKKIELKPLPMNMPQFEEWSTRIIKKADLPTENMETQLFALAGMILQSDPTEFFRPDEYYVNCLRKAAASQLAQQVIQDLKLARSQKQKPVEATTPPNMGVANGKEVTN